MAKSARVNIGHKSLIMLVCALYCCGGVIGSNVDPCPVGWLSYQQETPYSCVYVSDSTTDTLMKAHEKCVGKNASLIVIQSEKKMTFFKGIIQRYLSSSTNIWIGQQKDSNYGTVTWLTKDGKIPATSLPSGMRFSWYSIYYSYSYRHYNTDGLIYTGSRLYRKDNVDYSASRFMCEKPATCTSGWFGTACDKECHCHGQECDTSAEEITCLYGCKVGWTGNGCDRAKEDADVRYFCVNSPDQGKYAHVRIDTKGLDYQVIQAVNEDGQFTSWCNNTAIHTDNNTITTIKIYTDNSTDQDIQDESCAGKIVGPQKYEWRIKMQEIGGIVSRQDQEVSIQCDFSDADNLQLSGDTAITRESWFRSGDIKKAVEKVQEWKEKVELTVVDPSTGRQLSNTQLGSPVALLVNYGLDDDNAATGVLPYSCFASSVDGEQSTMFLDDRGCPMEGFPISGFSRNGTTKSLTTTPFPLFGFDGTDDVHFRCSYTLCFGEEPCLPDCEEMQTEASVVTDNLTLDRFRRHAGNRAHIMRRAIRVQVVG